jgi:transposase-like protein
VRCASVAAEASPEGRAGAALDARRRSAAPGAGRARARLGASRSGGSEWRGFSVTQVPEAIQPSWTALQAGEFVADAAARVGTHRTQARRWIAACGGVRLRRGRNLKGRCVTFAEREEIALARARGETIRVIARRLGRSPSTISRQLRRNADRRDGGYRATTAHALAHERASRPEPAKLAVNLPLRAIVQDDLRRRFSPEQIAGRCVAGSPTTRRCGFLLRPSTSRCTCSRAARSSAS